MRLVKVYFVMAIVLIISGNLPAQKRVYLWIDATANFRTFSSPDSIATYLNKAASAGITDIIVDVKPISGEVLYRSKIAPTLKDWNGFTREREFDYLNTFISEGHSRKIKVYAAMNVFTEGHVQFKRGKVNTDKSHWKTQQNTFKGLLSVTERTNKSAASVNPVDKEVQEYEISVMKEIVGGYDIDGLVLDRMRYDGIESDFSPLSLKEFENYAGYKIKGNKERIFGWAKKDKGKFEKCTGDLFNIWLEWRASVISEFAERAKIEVKKLKPEIELCNFSGGWYDEYYETGVNWASTKYDPSLQYKWANEKYRNYSILPSFDRLFLGNFYYESSPNEIKDFNNYLKDNPLQNMKERDSTQCIETACEREKALTLNEKPVISSLYLLLYKDNPSQLRKAIAASLNKSDGIMLFDIVYINKYNLWDILTQELNENKF